METYVSIKKSEFGIMIHITAATEKDVPSIAQIGYASVGEAHRDSCSKMDLQEYLEKNYNETAIKDEINDPKNAYHLLTYQGKPAGFSNIILHAQHPNIASKQAAKLDRIYLLKEFYDAKLGYELLKYNIAFAKNNNQDCIWLFTWVGNMRAVHFYNRAGFTVIGSHQFKVTETHYNENHQMLMNFVEE